MLHAPFVMRFTERGRSLACFFVNDYFGSAIALSAPQAVVSLGSLPRARHDDVAAACGERLRVRASLIS